MISHCEMDKPRQHGTEPFSKFLCPSRRDHSKGATVKTVVKRNYVHPPVITLLIMIFPHHFDGTFHTFSARIGEEYCIGKCVLHQFFSQLLLVRDLIQIRSMPKLRRLVLQHLNHFRMRMTQRIYRNTSTKIEKALPLIIHQPATFASNKSHGSTPICR